MKKIKKLIFSAFGLLMICLTLALVSHNVIGGKANFDSDSSKVSSTYTPKYFNNYIPYSSLGGKYSSAKGGVGIAISTDMYHEAGIYTSTGDGSFVDNFSNLDGTSGSRTIYISYYLVIEDGNYGLDIGFDLSGLSSLGITYEVIPLNQTDLTTFMQFQLTLAQKVAQAGGNGGTFLSEVSALTAFTDCANTYSFTDEASLEGTGDSYFLVSAYSTSEVLTGEYLIGKIKLEVPSDVLTFDIPCVKWVENDSTATDNNSVSMNADPIYYDTDILNKFSTKIGSTSYSKDTTLTGTLTNGSYSIPLTGSGTTLSATIPAEIGTTSNDFTLNLSVAGNGQYEYVSGTDTGTGSWSTASDKVTLAKGQDATVNVLSKSLGFLTEPDNEEYKNAKATYTINIERRSSDVNGATATGRIASGTDATKPNQNFSFGTVDGANVTYDASTKTFKVPTLAYYAEKLEFSPVLVSSSTQTLGVSGTGNSVTSGKITYTLPSPSTTAINYTDSSAKLPFTITENGVTTTYYVNFARTAGDGDSGVDDSTFVVYQKSDRSVTLAAHYDSSLAKFIIDDVVPFDVHEIYFYVEPSSTNGKLQNVSQLSGSSPALYKIDTTAGNTTNTTPVTFTTTFKVQPQVGSAMTYSIEGKRAGASGDTGLNFTLTGVTTGATYNATNATVTNGTGTTIYEYTLSEEKVRFDLTPCASTSTITFGTTTNPTTSWNNSTMITNEYSVGTITTASVYYVKVKAQVGSHEYIFKFKHTDDRSTDTSLKDLAVYADGTRLVPHTSVNNQSNLFSDGSYFNSTTYTYYFHIGYEDAATITVDAVRNDDNKVNDRIYATNSATTVSTFSMTVSTLNCGTSATNSFNYYVQAENESFATTPYKIVIVREEGNSDAYLKNLKLTSVSDATDTHTIANSITDVNQTYYIVFNRGTSQVKVEFDKCHDKATVTETTNTVYSFSGSQHIVKTIKVTSQDKSNSNTYTFNLYAADQAYGITNIELFDNTDSSNPVALEDSSGNQLYYFNAATTGLVVDTTLPYSVKSVLIKVTTPTGTQYVNCRVNGAGSFNMVEGSAITKKVSVESEYNTLNSAAGQKTPEYEFKFTGATGRTGKNIITLEARYDDYTVNIGDKINTVTYSATDTDIKITDYDATKNKTTLTMEIADGAYISYQGNKYYPDTTTGKVKIVLDVNLDSTTTSVNKSFSIVPEKGTGQEYIVTITSDSGSGAPTPTITGINITSTQVPAISPYATNATPSVGQTYTLDKKENAVSISATMNTGTSYAVEYKGPSDTAFNPVTYGATTIPTPAGVTEVKVYPFVSGTAHPGYTFKLDRPSASNVTTLSNVTINGNPSSDPSKLQFNLPNSDSNQSLPLSITPTTAVDNITATLADGTPITLTKDTVTNEYTGTIPGLVPGDHEVEVVVYPEDGSTPKTHTVKIHVDYPTDLLTLEVQNNVDYTPYPLDPATFSPTHYNYNIEVADGTKYVYVEATVPTASQADVTITNTGKVGIDGLSSFDVVVKSKSGETSSTYTITISRKIKSSANDLLEAYIEVLNPTTGAYDRYDPLKTHTASQITNDFILPANTTEFRFGTGSKTLQVSPDAYIDSEDTSNLINNAKNERKIVVKAENGNPKTYTFNIYVGSADCQITGIELYNTDMDILVDLNGKSLDSSTFDPTQIPYQFTVPNSTSAVYLKVYFSSTATLKVDTSKYSTQDITDMGGYIGILIPTATTSKNITVQALSELAQLNPSFPASVLTNLVSQEYQITIDKQPLNQDATLKRLELLVDGTNKVQGFNKNTEDYIVENIGSIASVGLIAETNVSTSKIISVTYATTPISNPQRFDGIVSLGTILNKDYTVDVTITVQAEDPKVTKEYTITVSRSSIDPSKDNTVANLLLVDSNNTNHINPFDPTTPTYKVTIPAGVTEYTLSALTNPGSGASIVIADIAGNKLNNDIATPNSIKVPVGSSNWGQTITYFVTAVAQDTSVGAGQEYTIEVTIEKPNNDATLTELKVDGQQLITADNPTGPYNLSFAYEIEKANIYAKAADPKAKVEVLGVTYTEIYSKDHNLVVGVNTVQLKVIAQDGTPQIYEIVIERAPEAPKLDTLAVSGTYLRDEKGNRVAFDPDKTDYYVYVPNECNPVEVLATSSQGVVYGAGMRNVDQVGQWVELSVSVIDESSSRKPVTQYTLHVFRFPATYSNSLAEIVKVTEIPAVEQEFSATKTFGYAYTVPNNVKNLNVYAELQFEDDNVNDTFAAEYQVYGDKNLRVGLNNVVVVVTSADGTSQTTYLLQVTREPKQYEVNNKDEAVINFTLEQNKDSAGNPIEGEYIVKIGKKKTSEVDFTKFIENLNPNNQDLQVQVISDLEDNPDEVVVMITDGDEVEFVKFNVESEGNPGDFGGEEWIFLVVLGIILVVLTAILISVNRDKYGKITKKTNKKTERKENKEEAKRK